MLKEHVLTNSFPFLAAQKSRVFYSAPHAALCDICEGSDCGDKCSIKAEQQRSGQDGYWKDHNDEEAKKEAASGTVLFKAGSGAAVNSVAVGTLLMAAVAALF